MRRKLRAFLALPARERLAFAQLWLRLRVAHFALRRLRMAQAQHLLQALPCLSPGPVAVDRLAALADIALRHAGRPVACLERCLALEGLLRKQGLAPELRIGACRHDGELRFHAWLEQAGVPIGEPAQAVAAFLPLTAQGPLSASAS